MQGGSSMNHLLDLEQQLWSSSSGAAALDVGSLPADPSASTALDVDVPPAVRRRAPAAVNPLGKFPADESII